jgi:hypothetical protein
MRPVHLRTLLRWAHIGEAAFLAVYLYSPLRTDPIWTDVAQFVVFPLATLSGLWMWQQARIARWSRRLGAPAARA